MKGKKIDNIDYDSWLINGEDDPKGTVYEDERYNIIKEWLEYTDEEMEEVDLDYEWDSYLDWQEDCRAEALAEAKAEAEIERWESYADNL